MNQILIVKDLCKANQIKNLSFFEKLSKSFDQKNGSERDLYYKMTQLNKLRNKLGHELEYVLSESDVDELGYINGKEYVFEKYDFVEIDDLLRNTLIAFVADVSLFLFNLIYLEKEERKQVYKNTD
jgi:hypothetical protein